MISFILLAIIYLAFISLGLPDSILGVSLPAMTQEWGLSLSSGGFISMMVIGSTIVSTFLSGHVIKKLGTGQVTLLSCVITGSALLGFSLAPSYIWLLVLAVPLGLGGGAVDTALNNYIALHYRARHMNWLHSFWGVGATIGPLVMSRTLSLGFSWRTGYRSISFMQLGLAVVLQFTLPLWAKRYASGSDGENKLKETQNTGSSVWRLKGTKLAFLTMFLYCMIETSAGLWGSSFLIHIKGATVDKAASWMAFYYGGITIGRFFSGFISYKLNNRQMIRYGILIALAGTIFQLLPLPLFVSGASFILIGLGLSPVFPSMLHETPTRFGKEHSQVLIGYQMGFGYAGSAFMPPLLGILLQITGMGAFSLVLPISMLTILAASEKLNYLSGAIKPAAAHN